MKTPLIFVMVLGFLSAGCESTRVRQIKASIVAPTGPATAAVAPAIAAAEVANAAALSKIAASAYAISLLNRDQPESARTTAVDEESQLIQTLAGEPSETDKLAASERARLVAEGKAQQVAAAYADVISETDLLRSAINEKTADLQRIQEMATKEQAEAQRKFQAEITRVTDEANRRISTAVKEAQDKARSEQRKLITYIFFGLGALFVAGGIVVMLTAASVPMFGPRAGIALIGSGGGLISIGIAITQIQNFLDAHPIIVGGGILLCIAAVAGAVALMWANHHHQTAALPAPAP